MEISSLKLLSVNTNLREKDVYSHALVAEAMQVATEHLSSAEMCKSFMKWPNLVFILSFHAFM